MRGKIALFAAAEAEIPPKQRAADRRLAAAAFDLACSYGVVRGSPALLITVGFSGSGKSVLARELARRLPAVRISSDEVRKEMARVAPASPLPARDYRPAERERVYQELFRRAEAALALGEHVILDATFLEPRDRERAAVAARDAGVELWVLECRCPDAVIRRRLRERARRHRDASDATAAVYETQLAAYEPRDAIPALGLPRMRRLEVSTEPPAGRAARRVLRSFWDETFSSP